MDYPIYENGREIGRLSAREDGLYTVFEAVLRAREGLTKLYLLGEDGWRVLGVMEPRGETCRLVRRLSRAALPGAIRCAATSPGASAVPEKRAEEAAWVPGVGGTLRDARRGLVAFPARLRAPGKGARIALIDGKEYIVFRW